MLRCLLSVCLLTLALGGCGTPSVHTAAPLGETVRDDGIVGEWATSDPAAATQIRAIITGPTAPTTDVYPLSLTLHHEGKFKTSLNLEMRLTEIGRARYADLFLARSERDKIVETYGFLAVPVHQVLKIAREGDELRAWPFDGSWLERSDAATRVSRERIVVGGGEILLITAPSEELRKLLALHGKDVKAFGDPITLGRLR